MKNKLFQLKTDFNVINRYLDKIDTSSSIMDVDKVFKIATRDYTLGKLDIDNYSTIANKIYYEIKEPSFFGSDILLRNTFEYASELSWFKIHNDKVKATMTNNILKKYLEDKKPVNDKLNQRQLEIMSVLFSYLEEGFRGSHTKLEIIKKSFLLLLSDYFNDKLKTKPDLYTIEAFAGHMLFVVNTPDEIKKYDQKLTDALDTAADITYYVKDGKKENNLDQFKDLIQNLKDYYESEKKVVQY